MERLYVCLFRFKDMKIHQNLIEQAISYKAIKPLAFYALVKHRTSSIIYNANYKRLANITGLSWQTCKKYTEKLIKMGFVARHKNNLLFRNQFKVDKTIHKLRHKLKEGNFKHILNQIYSLLLLNNKRQQKFNVAKKYGTNKKVKKIITSKIEDEIFFSTRSVAKLFAVSKTTAVNLLNSLQKNNIIKREPKLKFIKNMSVKELKHFITYSDNPFRYRYNKGHLYLHQGFRLVPLVSP